jgi:Uncharacterised protein family (UPF0236)
VSKAHSLSPKTRTGFNISPYLQETACYLGQSLPFDEGSEMLAKLTGCDLSDKQIERVSHFYGQLIEEQALQEADSQPFVTQTALHYAMTDGSMVFTRQDGWREMKLGRVFAAKDMVNYKDRREVTTSLYTAHLGNHTDFFEKFDRHLDGLKNLVAIADGAPWIWDFFDTTYPDAIQILDFFHAMERLSQLAVVQFKDKDTRSAWIEEQRKQLLDDKVEVVIQTIKELVCKGQNQDIQQKTITYLNNNKRRMLYKTYTDKGYLIGSGAIESAHRHVIQQRMKLAGQRWTIQGVQQIANLRVTYKNGFEQNIKSIIKKAA